MSGAVVLTVALALGAWWLLSSEERVASYDVRGEVDAVSLDVDHADVEIVGARDAARVSVQRTDRFAFGHEPEADRSAAGGVLRLGSRCPRIVVGSCGAAYRVTVPANLPLTIRTTSGGVRFAGYRGSARVTTDSGDVAVADWCGFSLQASSHSGDVSATATCAPERLSLRSVDGDARAVVPPGVYTIEASSNTGDRRIRGLQSTDAAAFSIQVVSGGGDATVEAAA